MVALEEEVLMNYVDKFMKEAYKWTDEAIKYLFKEGWWVYILVFICVMFIFIIMRG